MRSVLVKAGVGFALAFILISPFLHGGDTTTKSPKKPLLPAPAPSPISYLKPTQVKELLSDIPLSLIENETKAQVGKPLNNLSFPDLLKKKEDEQNVDPKEELKKIIGVNRKTNPNDAIRLAFADIQSVENYRRQFIRYLWVPTADIEDIRAMSFAINTISRGTRIARMPVVTSKLKLINHTLIRIDLRKLSSDDTELKENIEIWEEFRFDPRFNLIVTKDTIDLLRIDKKTIPTITKRRVIDIKEPYEVTEKYTDFEKKEVIKEPKETFRDPKTGKLLYKTVIKKVPIEKTRTVTKYKIIKKEDLIEVPITQIDDEVIRIPSEYIDQKTFTSLKDTVISEAPIVHYQYFLVRALAQRQYAGAAKSLYSGLYYKFAGIKSAKELKLDDKATDEDVFFETLGIGNIAAGVTAKKLFDKLQSDQRVAMFRSGVTARPRRVDFFRSLIGYNSSGFVSVTHDLTDENIDITKHPMMNLVDFKDDARELIADKKNGLQYFILFDGNGNLQNEAPNNVVSDRTIPGAHPPILEPAISCIRCHGLLSKRSLFDVKNDVQTMYKSYLDIYGDIANRKEKIFDTLNRLAGQYAGSPDKRLMRARDDYSEFVLRATGPWKAEGNEDQTKIVLVASKKISSIFNSYKYDTVDARRILFEMGFDVPEKSRIKPKILFNLLVPPLVNNAVNGIVPEDPRIHAIRAGIPINRVDWDLIYSFVMARANATLVRVQDAQKGANLPMRSPPKK